MRLRLLLAATVAALVSGASPSGQAPAAVPQAETAPTAPNDYTRDESWLCRPGRDDACDIDLTTTVVAASGATTRETWTANPKASIDCFYIYPTISTDPGVNSDMTADPAEVNVVAQQFARFGSVCRPFAPLYRQVTLAGLRQRMGGAGFGLGRGLAYDDVRDAWNDYLRRDNNGRGVVLVGHSQGSFILEQLIRNEIDGKPVQARLVSAILLGATISVPRGKDVGGSFQHIPVCRTSSQTGCLISYASYRSTMPPPANTLFGHVADEGMEAVCTNPVTLDERSGPLHAYLSSTGRTIASTSPPKPWAGPDATIDTAWVSVPGLLTARCATNEHATFLEITVHGDPSDPRADEITGDIGAPGRIATNWGLHLIDANLAMGNLVNIVGHEATAWAARRP